MNKLRDGHNGITVIHVVVVEKPVVAIRIPGVITVVTKAGPQAGTTTPAILFLAVNDSAGSILFYEQTTQTDPHISRDFIGWICCQ